MKIAPFLKNTFLTVLCVYLCINTYAADVRVSLKTPKLVYRMGDDIDFRVSYENVSGRPLLLLPQAESYPVDVFSIRKIKGVRKAEVIRLGEQAVDFEGLSGKVVSLQPRDFVSRSIKAEIRSSLPAFYGDNRAGLFLVFPASAVRLPGFGTYEIRANFHASPNHPVNAYLKGRALWRGDVKSGSVILEISE